MFTARKKGVVTRKRRSVEGKQVTVKRKKGQ